ncbi:MAG: amino-acid N-acetyltransferase [Treponemataceae bacterium]|nr:amino-acid N-acetyltransferase [Treponemataceae bacterium]
MREIIEKANQIRDVINYIKVFKNALAVIHIDDEIISSPLLPSHIHDISLIHEAGIKVIIVPGARGQINDALEEQKISWQIKNGFRITNERAMPAIKTAVFDVANNIMNILAGEHLTAVIGNWVKARGKGIIDGTDFGSAGEIDKIKIDAIKQTLENGFVPIFPCIGWNDLGKPYNISSTELAAQIAIHLKAEKLFFIFPDAQISRKEFSLPNEIALSQEGNVPAMNVEILSKILKLNSDSNSEKNSRKEKLLAIFKLAKNACENGVSRIHILDGNSEGILPCEIFSAIGSGTMIFNNGYGDFRPMRDDDIPSVLSLMNPFVKSGILLPRNFQELKSQLHNYIVYNVDGGIHACAALKKYDGDQMEIYSVAVDEAYGNMGVGPKMIDFLLEKAKSCGAKSVFILTTQTADWFEKLGFVADEIDSIPQERKKIWSEKRGSKVFRILF